MLPAILLVALVLRLAFVLYLDPERIYFSDTIDYHDAAQSLLRGEGFGAGYQRPPLYPLYLAGILAVFPGNLVAVRVADVLLGCLTVLLVYRLGREIWGREVGLIAAAIAAVHPYLVTLGGLLYPESLFAALLAGSVWILLRGSSPLAAAAAGLLAGAGALAKASGLALLPAAVLWLLVFGVGSRGARLRSAAAFVAGALLLVAPWTMRNAASFGEVSATDARTELHLPYRIGDRFVSKDEASVIYHARGQGLPRSRDALADIRAAPGAYAAFVGRQLVQFWSPWPERLATADPAARQRAAGRDARMVVENHPVRKLDRYGRLLGIALLPYYALALAGVVTAGRGRLRKASLPLLLVLGFAVGYALFFAKLRYRLPIEPFVCLFAGAGLHALVTRAPGRNRTRAGGVSPRLTEGERASVEGERVAGEGEREAGERERGRALFA